MRKFLLISFLTFCVNAGHAQITYTWNGSGSPDWTTTTNWSPNGVPSLTDNIIIVTGSNPCRLSADVSINNLTLTSGTLNLAGYVITVNGTTLTCNAGTIQPGRLVVTGANSVSFGNGPLVFNCKTNITSAAMIIRNTRFEDSVVLVKTGASNDGNHGNNIFNAPLEWTHAGSGSLVLGTAFADQFNAPSVFNNTGTGNFYVANNVSGHIFNAPVTFNNTPAGNTGIYVSGSSSSTVFNADIIVNSTAGQGVIFCNGNSTAQATLSAGHSIYAGALGFSAGILHLRQFQQIGITAQNLLLTGTATLRVGPSSVLNGDFTSESPGLLLNGGVFNGNSSFRKTGASGDFGAGGNTFNGVCSLTNSGSSYLVLGNSNPDIWNGDVVLTSNGSERLLPCWNSTGNQFNGDIYVNSSDSSRGISFCSGNSTATATLAAGKTIFPGTVGLTAGYLYLKQFTHLGTTPLDIVATGTGSVYLGPLSEFSAPVSVTAPNIYCQGTVYHSPVSFIKTGGGNNNNSGYLNIFESTCTIDQQSNGGYFMLSYRSSDQFLDDIIVNSSGTGGIYFGSSTAPGTATLAAGKTIRVGASGFSQGFLHLKRFLQLGSAPIQLDFTGINTYLAFSDTTVIGGPVITSTPGIYFNGANFKNKVYSIKTGTSSEQSQGGNVFEDSVTLINNGTGYWNMGNGKLDSFYTASHFESNGSSSLTLGNNSSGNYFGSNITVSSTGSSRGIYFCSSNTSTAVLKSGHSVEIGSNGFSSGSLALRRFTQEGNQPVNMILTGTSGLIIGPDSRIGGDITASAPSVLLNGCEYAGASDFNKTGAASDNGEGGNIFQGLSRITNSGSSYFMIGDKRADTWNADVIFTNSGSERILPAWATADNLFNGDIYLNTTGSATGIRFCGGNTTATATLAAGKTIAVGTDGFNSGNLQLRQFTQLGNTPLNLVFNSTATYIQYGPSSVFNADITSSSPGLFFHSSTFNGKVNSTKTGGNSDYSNGGNLFNDDAVITNAGTAALIFGNTSADIFSGSATFNNTGSGNMYVANNGTANTFRGITKFSNSTSNNSAIYVSPNAFGTQFENNILVASTSGGGVQFGNNSAGTVSLASGRTISVDAAGFTSGLLLLRQFTQVGATPQVLSLSGAALTFGPSSNFGGAVTTTSGSLNMNGCLFDGAAIFSKTGTSNDNSIGGNMFHSTAAFTNSGTGYLLMANVNADSHSGNVSFTQSGTGKVYPNYNANVNYAGNISVESPSGSSIVFGNGAGFATFTGSGSQAISAVAGSAIPVFTRLVLANTGSGLSLNASINVSKILTLTSGRLHTSTTNILTLLNNSTTSAGTALSTSYIDGPLRYQKASSGSSVLNFPIGNGNDCRPVVLTLNHTNNNLYTYQAQLFNSSATALNYTLPASVAKVSDIHYYTINRMNSSMVNQPTAELSGNQGIEVFFGANDAVTDGSTLTIVKNTYNAPNAWINIGGNGAPAYNAGASLVGRVASTSGPSSFNSFSTFALGNVVGGMNVLPVTLLSFQASPVADGVALNWSTASEQENSYFTCERSTDASSFSAVTKVLSKAPGGNSSSTLTYSSLDASPLEGVSYYRLKQTDIKGQSTYSRTVKVDRRMQVGLNIYPNPASDIIYISGFKTGSAQATVELYDMSGKIALKKILPVTGGYVTATFNLPAGIYSVKVSLPDGTSRVQQLLIKR
jgi:hypothetical protein